MFILVHEVDKFILTTWVESRSAFLRGFTMHVTNRQAPSIDLESGNNGSC